MGNSVQHYPGYGYGPAQGHISSGPPVLSRQRQEGKLRTLRVRDQAKQTAHTGLPISIGLSENQPFGNTGTPSRKITKGPQIGHRYLKLTRL
jgi:hypothetical protein